MLEGVLLIGGGVAGYSFDGPLVHSSSCGGASCGRSGSDARGARGSFGGGT